MLFLQCKLTFLTLKPLKNLIFSKQFQLTGLGNRKSLCKSWVAGTSKSRNLKKSLKFGRNSFLHVVASYTYSNKFGNFIKGHIIQIFLRLFSPCDNIFSVSVSSWRCPFRFDDLLFFARPSPFLSAPPSDLLCFCDDFDLLDSGSHCVESYSASKAPSPTFRRPERYILISLWPQL